MNSKKPSYHGYRFPPEIICYAVWLHYRFCLSFRDVEDLLAQRGIEVSYESIRQLCKQFGPQDARKLKKRSGRLGDRWFLDEVFVTIQGQRQYLWRAVDQDGDRRPSQSSRLRNQKLGHLRVLRVQKRRNKRAAMRFFRMLSKGERVLPLQIITDKLKSYSAAKRAVMPSISHCTDQYANNRAEVSHEPTRQGERQMRGFKSMGQVQRFLSVHGIVGNLFRLGRHLTQARHYRKLRTAAFEQWQQVSCA